MRSIANPPRLENVLRTKVSVPKPPFAPATVPDKSDAANADAEKLVPSDAAEVVGHVRGIDFQGKNQNLKTFRFTNKYPDLLWVALGQRSDRMIWDHGTTT